MANKTIIMAEVNMDLVNKQEISVTLDQVYEAVEQAISEEMATIMSELANDNVKINKNLVRINLQLSDILVRLSIIEDKVV